MRGIAAGMPTLIVKHSVAITVLTFLVWLGFAAIFPDDRLGLAETTFVWVVVAVAFLVCRSAARALVRLRAWFGQRPRH